MLVKRKKNAGNQHFLLFPLCFKIKPSISGSLSQVYGKG